MIRLFLAQSGHRPACLGISAFSGKTDDADNTHQCLLLTQSGLLHQLGTKRDAEMDVDDLI